MTGLRLQVKSATDLPVRGAPAPFTLAAKGSLMLLSIDGRIVPISTQPATSADVLARCIARVPAALRDALAALIVHATPNPSDAAWAAKYRLPVKSGMGADASGSGKVVVYPHGLALLQADEDAFVRGLMHELGHCWSLRDWAKNPADREAWLRAIQRDPTAASIYAERSFANAGAPDEDVAETTALYFLVRSTDRFERYRAAMPARFALLDARFAGSDSKASDPSA